MPGIVYEETEGFVGQGDAMLLYSDGMVEQHGPDREMYGFPRLRSAMAGDDAGSAAARPPARGAAARSPAPGSSRRTTSRW